MEAAAVQRGNVSQERSGIEVTYGRARILGAVSHVGAADAGSSRNAGRIHRGWGEDGDSGESGGEGFNATSTQSGSGRHSEALYGFREEAHAQGSRNEN